MTAKPFTFARAFPETTSRYVPLEEKEPMMRVSEHEDFVAAATASAREEGFMAGKSAADAEETARLASAMESVARALDELRFQLDEIHASASGEALHFAHGFARHLAGQLVDAAPMEAIEGVARRIFDDLRGQPHVAVRVGEALVEPAKAKMAAIARERGFEGRLIIMGEPEIAPGDVRIEWADGGIVRDQAAADRLLADSVTEALKANMRVGA
jgi:flagellar assembly protein FliH